MPEHREALLVMRQFKFPVASADGTRQEMREFHAAEFLPRADWDRAPARSRRSMINTGFVRDPLSVQINTIQDPGGIDRKLQSRTTGDGGTRINTTATETTGQPVKRNRGRPRKMKE